MNLDILEEDILSKKFFEILENKKIYNPAINKHKLKAWNNFSKTGIPTNKIEDYKYTDCRKIFEKFSDLNIKRHDIKIYQSDSEYRIDINLCSNLKFQKDNTFIEWSQNKKIDIDGKIVVYDLNDESHIAKNINILNKLFKSKNDNPMAELNNSFFISPILVNINKDINKPIKINYNIEENDILLMPNIIFNIQSDIKASIINIYPQNKKNHIINDNISIFVDKYSKADYYSIQNSNENCIINNSQIYLEENSNFILNNITHSSKFIRNNISISLEGKNSEAHLNGLYYGKNDNHIDNNIQINHLAPNTYSNQLYKGIVTDTSLGIFNGKIFVDKLAQKTNAFQLNNVLILSEKAKAKTKPQLEIYADDVKCSHGATIGQLDEDQLFYLRTRGISLDIAKSMITKAFIEEILDKIDKKYIMDYIDNI
ncbi:MAG: Fe-S cluster assembly protein SufD [Bacteroidetes bacterium]|nr:Fe-S cluster assembly protein SufD [Bacteroidota bacterium]